MVDDYFHNTFDIKLLNVMEILHLSLCNLDLFVNSFFAEMEVSLTQSMRHKWIVEPVPQAGMLPVYCLMAPYIQLTSEVRWGTKTSKDATFPPF